MKPTIIEKDRPRGRPADRGQPDLKTAILNQAEDCFAENGYTASSVRVIADQAGVNPALIHYYFGNKHSLLQQVMERALQPLMGALVSLKESDQAPVTEIADLLLSMVASHPNIPKLLTREVLLPGGEMRDFFAETLAPKLGGALPALLEREKVAGRVRNKADTPISSLLIMSLCVFPFVARSLAEPVLGVSFDKDGIEKLSDNISDLLNKGIAA